MEQLASLPFWLQIGIGLLALVGVGLLVAAQVVIWRTPVDRLTAPRLVWALVAFVNFVGPIAFFLAGRKPAEVEVAPAPRHADTTDRAVELLYGDEDPRT